MSCILSGNSTSTSTTWNTLPGCRFSISSGDSLLAAGIALTIIESLGTLSLSTSSHLHLSVSVKSRSSKRLLSSRLEDLVPNCSVPSTVPWTWSKTDTYSTLYDHMVFSNKYLILGMQPAQKSYQNSLTYSGQSLSIKNSHQQVPKSGHCIGPLWK